MINTRDGAEDCSYDCLLRSSKDMVGHDKVTITTFLQISHFRFYPRLHC